MCKIIKFGSFLPKTDLDNENDKEVISGICDTQKDAINQMTKENNDMVCEINEMSDRIKNSALDHKKELEANQGIIKSYAEKVEKQDIELMEFKSEIARLKVDLEDEKQVSSYGIIKNTFLMKYANYFHLQ